MVAANRHVSKEKESYGHNVWAWLPVIGEEVQSQVIQTKGRLQLFELFSTLNGSAGISS